MFLGSTHSLWAAAGTSIRFSKPLFPNLFLSSLLVEVGEFLNPIYIGNDDVKNNFVKSFYILSDTIMKDNFRPTFGSDDPYAILNVDRNASESVIQSSYKRLSRSFHPDKQQQQQQQQQVMTTTTTTLDDLGDSKLQDDNTTSQDIFVKLKNAHDILMDPILRLVYDEFGYDAVQLVRRTMHSSSLDANALYPKLQRIYYQTNNGTDQKQQEVKAEIARILRHIHVEKMDKCHNMDVTIELPCDLSMASLSSSPYQDMTWSNIPDILLRGIGTTNGSILSVTTGSSSPMSSSNKLDTSLRIQSSIKDGFSKASSNLTIGYRPDMGTHMSTSLETIPVNMHMYLSSRKKMNIPMRLSCSTTRTFQNSTIVTASAGTIVMTSTKRQPSTDAVALSLVTYRNLRIHTTTPIQASWAIGMGTDLKFHYGILSLMSLSNRYPRCVIKLNLGLDPYPLLVSAQHVFGGTRTGFLSLSLGPSGIKVKAMLSRYLTSYSKWTMSIQHVTNTGLSWILEMNRGNFTFRVPIFLLSVGDPWYSIRMWYIALWTGAIDNILSSFSQNFSTWESQNQHHLNVPASKELRQNAEQQIVLMKGMAERNMERESNCNGLVIYQATYFIDGGPSLDARIQLQFLVQNSTLCLPEGSKCNLLGFYNLLTPPYFRKDKWSWNYWFSHSEESTTLVPQLKIRYTFEDTAFEITIKDSDPLVLPNNHAMPLGPKNRVR